MLNKEQKLASEINHSRVLVLAGPGTGKTTTLISRYKHLINTGAGLELMNVDSKIVEYIIRDFVKTDTPILTVHDSFIVPFGEEDRLEKLMKEAFVYVTNKNKTKVKFNKNLTLGHVNQVKYSTGPDRDYYLDSMHAVNENVATEGYRKRLERHTRYHLPD